MNEYLTFRKMITPIAIQVLFWLGVAVCVIAGIVNLARGEVEGIVVLIIGPIVVRIYCEILIVVFRMLDALQQLVRNTSGQGSAPADAPPQPEAI